MLFVDGENLTIRAQRLAKNEGISLTEGKFYLSGTFVWMPKLVPATLAMSTVPNTNVPLQPQAVRAHYYTSIVGDEDRILEVKNAL